MHLGLTLRIAALSLGIPILAAGGYSALAEAIPPGTTFPVAFEQTIDANKAKPGDTILAKTIEAVPLPDGEIAKGAVVSGHVIAARPFRFDPTPYAAQQASYLCVHFDKVIERGRVVPLSVSVRALANRDAAYEASRPQSTDDTDHLGTMVLIGGSYFSPIGKRLLSPEDEDVVGYIHNQGVFARLLPGDYVSRYSGFHCGGSETEQAMGIFSPDACGVYGFRWLAMTDNGGGRQPGCFRLESRHSTVKLYNGSAALLEETPSW